MNTDIADLIAGVLGVSRGTAYDMMREALAVAQQQEPVAYMNQNGVIHHADYEWLGAGNILTPLYTSPQPAQDQGQSCYCPNCEALSKELAALKAQQPYDTHAAPGQSFDTHGRTPPAQQTEPCGWRMKHNGEWAYSFTEDAWDFIRRVPKAQQQEPVAVYVGETWCGSVVRLYKDLPLETPLYTSPPSHAQTIKDQEAVVHRLQKRYADLEAKVGKPWVPLTEFDIDQIPYSCSHADSRLIAYAIEAKLREKNA